LAVKKVSIDGRLIQGRLIESLAADSGRGAQAGLLLGLLLAQGDVPDGDGDLSWFASPGRERAKADFHGEDGAVLAAAAKLTAGAHVARSGRAMESLAERRMVGTNLVGHEDLDGLADEFVAGVAEELFTPSIGQADDSVGVGHHQTVRRQFEHAPEELLGLAEVFFGLEALGDVLLDGNEMGDIAALGTDRGDGHFLLVE
jgi:hypothetical protein